MASSGYKKNSEPPDDTISCCGSIGGETFCRQRKRSSCTLRKHSLLDGRTGSKRRMRDLRQDSLSRVSGKISVGRSISVCSDLEPAGGQTCPNVIPLGVDQVQNAEHLEAEVKQRFNSSFHGYRFLVVMLGGISLGLMILLRFNISVAILNMVNQTALYMEDNPDKTVDDFLAEGYSLGGEFDWDNEVQHMIMSLYMFAYTLPQVLSTRLGIRLGARLAMPLSLGTCALATLLTPWAAYQGGWRWVVALRLLNGVGASAVLPLMLHLIENWMPYKELSLGLTCAQILQATLVMANPLVAGELCAIHWSYAFYVPAIFTLIFSLLFLFLVTDRPDENWFISQRELDLICACPEITQPAATCCKEANGNKTEKGNENNKEVEPVAEKDAHSDDVSVLQVFKMPAFYGYIFIWIFHCSTYNCFSFILPTYLRQFLKISVAQNGFYCSLIQSGCVISVLWPHPIMRFLQETLKLQQTSARRVTFGLICFMVAGTWIYVGLFHESQLLLLFLNRCFQGSNDIVVTGSIMANFAKANLSGLVFSMVNTVGNLSLVVSSPLIGYVLDYTGQSREGWCWILSAMGLAQVLILISFSTIIRSEPIEFDKRKPKEDEKLDRVVVASKETVAQKTSDCCAKQPNSGNKI